MKEKEPENVTKFRKVTEKMVELYARKNRAYGNSFGLSVKKYGLTAALTRISDKFNRFETLLLSCRDAEGDESLRDTLLDMASYAIMTYICIGDDAEPDAIDETENKIWN